MAKRRMIDPTIWEDEHFGDLSPMARILFVACISHADDDGRLGANPKNLRALAFRYDDITISKIEEHLAEIMKKLENFIVYGHNSHRYIQLRKWEEYQFIRKDRYTPSRIPPCQPNDNQMTTKGQPSDGIDKVSLDKISIDKKGFVRPSLKDLKAFISENNLSVDADAFIDHYESNGWKIGGKSSMKSWQASVRNWNRRNATPKKKERLL